MYRFLNALKFCLVAGIGFTVSSQAAVKKLNPTVGTGGAVLKAEFVGSNATTVVYLSNTNGASPALLFSAPVTGGAPTDLSGAVAGQVLDFKVTPDGNQVVYLAQKDNALISEVYSVSTSGGTSTKLNAALVAGGNVLDFQLSRDGSQVVYRADQVTLGVPELFVAPVAGGAATQVSDVLVPSGSVTNSYAFTPDGSGVVYIADQDTDQINELYRVAIGTPGSTKLNTFLGLGENVFDFKISPVGNKVVYRTNSGGVTNIRSVELDGTGDVQVNFNLVAGGSVKNIYDILPDGSQVVYVADQETVGQDEIYIIPITGGAIFANLNPSLAGDVSGFEIVGAKNSVLYQAGQTMLNVEELFSVPLIDFDTNKVQKVNPSLANDRTISAFKVSSDASTVVYLANQDLANQVELYRVAYSGEDAAKINAPLVNGGNVIDFRISPDNKKVIYLADQETIGAIELYVADLVSLNADYNQDGKNDILIQSKKTLQLLSRDGGGNFQPTNFAAPLTAKQKVLTSKDLNGDGKPEIVLGQGKSISIVTVSPDLQQSASSVGAPTLSKGFKLTASGRAGTNTVFVSSKGKKLEVLVGGQKLTGEVEKGNKVFGFEKINGQPSVLLSKGSAISVLPLAVQSNQFSLGTALNSGSVSKGAKPSGVVSLNFDSVEVITKKGKEVRAFTLPASGEGSVLFTAPKKVKVVGPR